MDRIFQLAKNFGGSLSDYTVWLLERSLKTMGIRVRAQNENALVMAHFLDKLPDIEKVYYPGLPTHPEYDLAKKQMRGFGGMLSFELNSHLNSSQFQKALQLIKPSMSLAGVESTVISPTQTSHALMSAEVRAEQGIADGLIRFSVGIEEVEDLQQDILQALESLK
jgi:cystathionine beta-lyase